MKIRLLLVATIAGVLTACATPTLAQQGGQSLVVTTCNTQTYPTGVLRYDTQTQGGVKCITGTISATTSATASATPTPVVAGTGKPLNIGLFSDLFATLTDGAGNIISPMTKTGGTVTANAGTNLNTSALALDATVAAMSAKLPAVLGSTTKAGSLSVTFASDQTLPAFAATPTFNIGTGGPSGYTLEAGHIATVDTSTALLAVPFTAGNPIVCNATASMTGTTQTSLCAAPGANLHNYVTQIVCGNSSATVGTFVDVEDGSGGTVLVPIPAGISYQGGTLTFPLPGLRQPTANTALFLVNETTGAAVKCSAVGYKGS